MTLRHTVLLVEDEPFVLTVMERLLAKLGYEVVSFRDPVAAALHKGMRPPSLMITDIVMPGMNGFHLCDVMRDRFPGLPVIFTSGYPLDDLPEDAEDLPPNSLMLSKPFGIDVLKEAVLDMISTRDVASGV